MTDAEAREYERRKPKMAALIRKVVRDNREALRMLAEHDRVVDESVNSAADRQPNAMKGGHRED